MANQPPVKVKAAAAPPPVTRKVTLRRPAPRPEKA